MQSLREPSINRRHYSENNSLYTTGILAQSVPYFVRIAEHVLIAICNGFDFTYPTFTDESKTKVVMMRVMMMRVMMMRAMMMMVMMMMRVMMMMMMTMMRVMMMMIMMVMIVMMMNSHCIITCQSC